MSYETLAQALAIKMCGVNDPTGKHELDYRTGKGPDDIAVLQKDMERRYPMDRIKQAKEMVPHLKQIMKPKHSKAK